MEEVLVVWFSLVPGGQWRIISFTK